MISFQGNYQELVILTEHFSPSTGATAQLITDLADDLHANGVRITILTSTASSFSDPYPVVRFSSFSTGSVDLLSKLLRGVYFLLGTATWLFFRLKSNQCLLIVSNPPFAGLIGLLLRWTKGSSFIFLFQDVFPRSACLTGVLPTKGPIVWLWHVLMKLVVNSSKATVVLSTAMAQRCIREFGTSPELVVIPNWAIFSPHAPLKRNSKLAKEWNLITPFTIQYSGNFGRLHDILTILEAVRLLQTHSIKFVFVGGGAKASQITAYASQYDLKNLIVKPYQPRDKLCDSLSACDVAIVSLIPGAEDTVAPSKIYGILASSRPVVLIAPINCDLAEFVISNHFGLVVEPGDVVGLSSTLIELSSNAPLLQDLSANALHTYKKYFGRHCSTNQYLELFRKHFNIQTAPIAKQQP